MRKQYVMPRQLLPSQWTARSSRSVLFIWILPARWLFPFKLPERAGFKDFSFPYLKCKYERSCVCLYLFVQVDAERMLHKQYIMIIWFCTHRMLQKARRDVCVPWNTSEPSFLVLPVRVLKFHVFSRKRDWKRGTFGKPKGEFKIKTWHKVEISTVFRYFSNQPVGKLSDSEECVLTKKGLPTSLNLGLMPCGLL